MQLYTSQDCCENKSILTYIHAYIHTTALGSHQAYNQLSYQSSISPDVPKTPLNTHVHKCFPMRYCTFGQKAHVGGFPLPTQ